MKFGIIDPKACTVDVIDFKDTLAAYTLAGLDPNQTDHGVLMSLPNGALCFVVYEFGFYVPADRQHYFAFGPRLVAGNAVAYQVDAFGYTVSMAPGIAARIIKPTWFKSAADVEAAIAAGTVSRPEVSINGEVIWAWPNPAPPEFAERMK